MRPMRFLRPLSGIGQRNLPAEDRALALLFVGLGDLKQAVLFRRVVVVPGDTYELGLGHREDVGNGVGVVPQTVGRD